MMPEQQTSHKKPLRPILVLILILAAAGLLWNFFLRGKSAPKNIVKVSGRIESDDSAVAAKVAGRLKEVNVREGDKVTAGQIIAVLDDAQTIAREDQAKSAAQQADARVRWSMQQIGILNKQLEQSKMMSDQSRVD